VLAMAASTFLLVQTVWGVLWRPWLLSGSALLYIGYVVYLYGW
jgi:cation:H+ antiporter